MSLAEAFVVPASTRFRKHAHDSPHVCVVLDGGFMEREKKSWRDVARGTVRVSGAARHDIDFSPAGATCLLLEYDLKGFSSLHADAAFEKDKPALVKKFVGVFVYLRFLFKQFRL